MQAFKSSDRRFNTRPVAVAPWFGFVVTRLRGEGEDETHPLVCSLDCVRRVVGAWEAHPLQEEFVHRAPAAGSVAERVRVVSVQGVPGACALPVEVVLVEHGVEDPIPPSPARYWTFPIMRREPLDERTYELLRSAVSALKDKIK